MIAWNIRPIASALWRNRTGALLVALVANYTGFLAPKIALVSNILLMVAILLWRPQGLYPVAKR